MTESNDALDDGSPARPLAGIRVVDLSQNLAGPFATQILGDLGADVVKVEPPGGDAARAWGPPFQGGESPLFLCANRNKRSIVIDLGTERGRTVLHRLVEGCDVFVQAFRAGVVERLGFGYDTVRAHNPAVIYLSVTAFGTDGPLSDQPGYDPLMQAYGGLMSVTGPVGGTPVRVGTSVVDMGTGMWSAMAVMAALRSRDQDGHGSHVTTSLLDTSVSWMAYHLQAFFGAGAVPGPMGTGLGMIAPYESFPASDGEVMIAAGNDASFRRLCHALGLDGLDTDPRFSTNPARVSHRVELARVVADRTRNRDVAGLLALLRDAAVPCAPIQDVGQVAADAQVAAAGMLRPLPDAPIPGYVDVAAPMQWDGHRSPVLRPPPGVGEHTAEILDELDRASR